MADVQIDQDAANIPAVNLVDQSSDPTAPGAGHVLLYVKAGTLYVRLYNGTVVPVGGVAALPEGRLAVGDGDDLLSALALGTEGDVVTADASGFATWAAPSGGPATFSGASLTKSAVQSISGITETPLTFDGETFDTDAYHESVTNPSRFTAPATGYYLITATTRVNALNGGKAVQAYFKVDGAAPNPQAAQTLFSVTNGDSVILSVSLSLALTASSYVESFVWHNDTSPRDVDTSANGTSFTITRLG